MHGRWSCGHSGLQGRVLAVKDCVAGIEGMNERRDTLVTIREQTKDRSRQQVNLLVVV